MFDFSIYKGTRKYFKLFDIYIRHQSIPKEELFHKLYINNSSYRRARDHEQKIGKQIIKQLSDYFNLKVPNDELIDQIENLTNRVYNNMYYKVYNTYDEDLKFIDELLNDNCLLFPVLELLKVFLLMNSKKAANDLLDNNKELYYKVKKYKAFLTDELLEILEILSLFFENESSEYEWVENYDCPMSYQILAAKCFIKNKFIEAIFYAEKAKEKLIDDFNIKRIITLNYTIINSLLALGNYKKSYDVSFKQMSAIKALNIEGFDYEKTFDVLLFSLLGLKNYSQVLEMLKECNSFNSSEIVCFFTSLYFVDKQQYQKEFDENINILNSNNQGILNILNDYLKTKDKKILLSLENRTLNSSLAPILRRL